MSCLGKNGMIQIDLNSSQKPPSGIEGFIATSLLQKTAGEHTPCDSFSGTTAVQVGPNTDQQWGPSGDGEPLGTASH